MAAVEPTFAESVDLPGRRRDARAEVLGCRVDRLDMAETVARCEQIVDSGRPGQQVSINVAKLVELRRDERMRAYVEQCALVSADGQPVVWASRLLGDPLPERVAGIDLMHELLALAERRGFRVFFLGARREVLERAVGVIREAHPGLEVSGYRDGYFADSEVDDVREEIRRAAPHILFVAMSSPRKEHWLSTHAASLGIPFAMGVGGSIDIVAGITTRAPRWMRRTGLEWFYRFLQEPLRMWRRYLVTNTVFALQLSAAIARRTLRRS
jgi:N-acetylglucosaminyldiphosphoundecaprenol N-acetyl-beta-D-mannosaminyltransferase